jgi:hypothetical protein
VVRRFYLNSWHELSDLNSGGFRDTLPTFKHIPSLCLVPLAPRSFEPTTPVPKLSKLLLTAKALSPLLLANALASRPQREKRVNDVGGGKSIMHAASSPHGGRGAEGPVGPQRDGHAMSWRARRRSSSCHPRRRPGADDAGEADKLSAARVRRARDHDVSIDLTSIQLACELSGGRSRAAA